MAFGFLASTAPEKFMSPPIDFRLMFRDTAIWFFTSTSPFSCSALNLLYRRFLMSQLKLRLILREMVNSYSPVLPFSFFPNPNAKSWSRSRKLDRRSVSIPMGWSSNNINVITFLKNPFNLKSLFPIWAVTSLRARSLLLNCNEPFTSFTKMLFWPYSKEISLSVTDPFVEVFVAVARFLSQESLPSKFRFAIRLPRTLLMVSTG